MSSAVQSQGNKGDAPRLRRPAVADDIDRLQSPSKPDRMNAVGLDPGTPAPEIGKQQTDPAGNIKSVLVQIFLIAIDQFRSTQPAMLAAILAV